MFGRAVGFFFDQPTPGQQRYLRKTLLPALVVGHVAWACGWLPLVGVPLTGFAQSSDVDRKIALAAAAIETKIARVENEQAKTNAVLVSVESILLENMAEATRAKIRAQVAKRCKIKGWAEREEVTREIERLHKQHEAYAKGRHYGEPSCAEI